MDERLRIGVSACLMGERVRFDGGHCGDDFVRSLDVELVRVCPEVEMGDLTLEMERFARARVAALPDLDGFIVKNCSPSCGFERVKIYGDTIERNGQGLFTAALLRARPLSPRRQRKALCRRRYPWPSGRPASRTR